MSCVLCVMWEELRVMCEELRVACDELRVESSPRSDVLESSDKYLL
jgi:hypothetical protein